MAHLHLESLEQSLLDACTKGVPHGAGALRVREVAQQGWSILRQNLPLPVAVLRESALARNSLWMKTFLERNGCVISPHGKTTMAPQLFERQLADGAWGITAATPAQVQVYRHFGVPRILMANQLVDPQGIAFVMNELRRDPHFDFYCLVDSIEGVDLLANAVGRCDPRRPMQVLVEVGSSGGRTGARTPDACLAVAREVARSRHLALRGVEAYENVFPADPIGQAEQGIRLLMESVNRVIGQAQRENLFAAGPIIVTAGGSAYFDVVVDAARGFLTDRMIFVIRSGCYLTHDVGLLERSFARMQERAGGAVDFAPPLMPALEVWGYIQSCPEPGVAFATLGKRDVSYDFDLPKPILWFRPDVHAQPQSLRDQCRLTKLNDQHARLELAPGFAFEVGDMVAVGVSHPCTTFDKWQLVYVVDDDYNVIEGIRTYF